MAKKEQIQTGFESSTGQTAGRLFNKKGTPNVKRTGGSWAARFSAFHALLNLRFRYYLLLILGAYIVINLFFAAIYYALGPSKLGITSTNACSVNTFADCFFFSAQTLTTVGYGRISPTHFSSNVVSAVESLMGLLMFSLITGLSYARFAKPKSKILFSKNALLSPYKEGQALMFRLVNASDHLLSDAEVTATLAIKDNSASTSFHRFHTLELEVSKAISLPLNWTLVHAITESSPLWLLSPQELANRKMELLVFVKAYDEHYSNHVQQRTSYTHAELVHGAKFDLMFHRSTDENSTTLEIDKLSDYTPV